MYLNCITIKGISISNNIGTIGSSSYPTSFSNPTVDSLNSPVELFITFTSTDVLRGIFCPASTPFDPGHNCI
jgi:hypothetical protein